MKKPRTGVTNKYIFIELAHRYSDITLQEIEETERNIRDLRSQLRLDIYGHIIAKQLTGFGSGDCTLCRSTLKFSCNECYWLIATKQGCSTHKTYNDIYNAKNKYELKIAMNARSKYMFSVDRKDNINLNKEK